MTARKACSEGRTGEPCDQVPRSHLTTRRGCGATYPGSTTGKPCTTFRGICSAGACAEACTVRACTKACSATASAQAASTQAGNTCTCCASTTALIGAVPTVGSRRPRCTWRRRRSMRMQVNVKQCATTEAWGAGAGLPPLVTRPATLLMAPGQCGPDQ